ncbi:hypothetical protein KR054_001208 [Drosophila jambulina]|nr:hypothetical protein KR054_001208 [Drosophila jambulina]
MAELSGQNLSTSMCDMEEDPDMSASLLNHNVSFSSTMVTSSVDVDTSMPKLSITLSDAEKLKLKLLTANASANTTKAMETTSLLPETSLGDEDGEEDESDPVIAIEDTMELTATEEAPDEQAEEAYLEPEVAPPPPIEYFQSKIIELGRRCWTSSAEAQHYTKGCYWSPDGTCLLVPVHLDGMHVMELPADLYATPAIQTTTRDLTSLQSAVHVPEGGTVYDCVWYPHMNSQQPESCFWLATRQHEPIHMWDAFDGTLRCSYSGYDAVDEVMAAISLAFSADGQRIFAGYKRCIKIFDTNRPGRICDDYPVKFAISCIAQTGESPNTLTCGNWHGYIQHFDLRCSPKQGPLFTLGGHKGGITQLRYSEGAAGEWYLFSGARKCSKLLQWDMRNYKTPLAEFQRNVDTNQRIQFDFTADLSWLLSGNTRGALNIWDLGGDTKATSMPLHTDCCNGVALNPILPILATSSGQYHFIGNDEGDNITMNGTATVEEAEGTPNKLNPSQEVIYENAVVMWWVGPSAPN